LLAAQVQEKQRVADLPYNYCDMSPTAIRFDKTSEIHISEAEAVSDFARVLAYVRAGAKVVIDSDSEAAPVAVIFADLPRVEASVPNPPRRTISEIIAKLPEDSTAVMDADFARDIEAAIASHRESLKSAWE
jgi:hypothetical protein